jgi:hypothetical protein
MHARPDELLSLRDGEPVDARAAAHVRGCEACRAEIARLVAMRERLRSLPAAAGPAGDSWVVVRERLAARSSARRGDGHALGPYAAAASVAALALCAVIWSAGRPGSGAPPAAALSEVPAEGAALAELQARSRALEALLAELPDRPAVARAGTTVPIDALEAQVQWLDHQLSAPRDGVDAPLARELWRDRVELMDSLVQLRYVEAQSARL